MCSNFRLCFPAVPSGKETAGIKHSKNEFKIQRNQQLAHIGLGNAKYCIL